MSCNGYLERFCVNLVGIVVLYVWIVWIGDEEGILFVGCCMQVEQCIYVVLFVLFQDCVQVGEFFWFVEIGIVVVFQYGMVEWNVDDVEVLIGNGCNVCFCDVGIQEVLMELIGCGLIDFLCYLVYNVCFGGKFVVYDLVFL